MANYEELTVTINERFLVLSKYNGDDVSEMETAEKNNALIITNNSEYLVLTEEERYEAVEEHFADTLHYTYTHILAEYIDLPDEVIDACKQLDEVTACRVLRDLIERFNDWDNFINDRLDEAGEYLAKYDNQEGTETSDFTQTEFYIYRVE